MKKQVHYSIFEDMMKYIPRQELKNFEKTTNKTDSSVVSWLQEYYDHHLPVDVTAWVRVNEPNANLIYKDGLGEQVHFIRDIIGRLLFPSYESWKANPPLVIATHTSKSVKLPVYLIQSKKYGVEMILRNNFYDWKVSIKSDSPLDFDYMELFDPSKEVSKYCCEGFPVDKIYGAYSENNTKFTVEIYSNYELYTFIFLLIKHLQSKK